MSDLISQPNPTHSSDCHQAANEPVILEIPTREAHIGDNITIRRALPNHERRTIGAWCFLDHFGPINLKQSDLDIAPHPHIGLQTFTWTIHGEILHRDSLGSKQIIQPGQVNLMTAGYGIAHSEESLPDTELEGVQLWIALPDSVRNCEAEFHHYPSQPQFSENNFQITVLAGNYLNYVAPAKIYSPLIGLDIRTEQNAKTTLQLNPKFEYGFLVLQGEAIIANKTISVGTLLYLGCGRATIDLECKNASKIILIGGEPFTEDILMWWNFVARTEHELKDAVFDWNNHTRFGEVPGYGEGRYPAPAMKTEK